MPNNPGNRSATAPAFAVSLPSRFETILLALAKVSFMAATIGSAASEKNIMR